MLDSRLSCALSVARITLSLLQTPLRPCRLPHLDWLASDARYMVVVRCNDVQLPASTRIISITRIRGPHINRALTHRPPYRRQTTIVSLR